MTKPFLFTITTILSSYLLLKIFGPTDVLWLNIVACVLLATPLFLIGVLVVTNLPKSENIAHHSPLKPTADFSHWEGRLPAAK